jgi:dTDP-glucose 4,6-dehydratase
MWKGLQPEAVWTAVVNFAAETSCGLAPFSILRRSCARTSKVRAAFSTLHDSTVFRALFRFRTDEVYGSLDATGSFREDTPIDPNEPVLRSKAAADLLVLAYHKTMACRP